jgi:hypothetical protein
VLSVETPARELSKEKRRELEQRGKKAFKALEGTIRSANTLIAKAANFTPAEGLPLARAYLRTLAQFGDSLQKANNRSSIGAVAQIEHYNETMADIAKLSPDAFTKKLADMFRAEMQESVKGAARGNQKDLGDLIYPSKRAKATALANKRVREKLDLLERLERSSKDARYRNTIQPMMQKFIETIADTGTTAYVPTITELRAAQLAMRLWEKSPQTKADLYEPTRDFFKRLGVDLMSLKLGSDFKWSQPDEYLEKRDRFRKEAEPVGSYDVTLQHTATQLRDVMARDTPLNPKEIETFAKVQSVNEAIKQLRKTVENGTTLDIIAAEDTFVRAIQKMGLWEWTAKNLGMGTLTMPSTLENRADKQVSVRLMAGRLRKADITKKDAQQMMLEQYQPIPLSQEVRTDKNVKAAAKSALKPALRDIAVEDEIRELMRVQDMTPEQQRLYDALQRQDEDAANLFDSIDIYPHNEEVVPAVNRLAELLEYSGDRPPPRLKSVLDEIIPLMPEGHALVPWMKRIAALPQMNDVYALYADNFKSAHNLGQYREVQDKRDGSWMRSVAINRAGLDLHRSVGKDPINGLLHTFMHEAVHAATMGAIQKDSALKAATWALMRITKAELNKLGAANEYAFKDNDVREFVAEAFSNQKFQAKLRTIKIQSDLTLWQMFKNLVKRALGLEALPDYDNALDAILGMSDKLFTGDMWKTTRGGDSAANLDLDGATRVLVGDTYDRVAQTGSVWKRAWKRARDKAGKGLLPATTMEQLRDAYSRYWKTENGNPMRDYMRAFFQRNADNSEMLETADKLSRQWTALAEKDVDKKYAPEMSRLMTEATIHQMNIELPLSANSHLHPAAYSKFNELSKRFNALPEAWQDLYEDIGDHYEEALNREVDLMTLNALRGALTRGSDAPLSESEFDYSEGDIREMGLNTRAGLEREFGGLLDANMIDRIYKLASIPQQRNGSYFPLTRYGNYTVYAEREIEKKSMPRKEALEYARELEAKDPTLDVSVTTDGQNSTVTVKERDYRMYESRSEAESERLGMIDEYGEAAVSPVHLKDETLKSQATISSNSQLGVLLSKVDGNPAAQAALKNFYLQSLAENSFRKHEAQRKNTRGVVAEGQHRSFATYAKSSAYYTSQLRYGWQMADALRGMEAVRKAHRDESQISAVRMGEVLSEIRKRDEMTHDVPSVNKFVRSGVELSHFLMLTSPSYWMINATQPYMVSLPWLAARSSVAQATAALAHAQKIIASPIVKQMVNTAGGLRALLPKSKAATEAAFSVIEDVEKKLQGYPELTKMLETLKRNSVIDLSFVAELRDIASGKQSIAQNVLDASRIMSHLTEVNNRVMTAIAAYDIGKAKGMTPAQATDFAQQAVSITQFNYSSGNKPRLFGTKGPLGPFGPLAFQFMQYTQHMYALLFTNLRRAFDTKGADRKVAIKTVAGILATHFAAGGVIGATIQPIKWAFGLAAWLFGSADEPYDFDQEVREVSAELFGTKLGAMIATGPVPRAVGVDLSNRMSLGTLYMVDLKTDNANSFLGSMLQSFGGPAASLAASGFNGVKYMLDGEASKAIESVTPKIIKDALRAARFGSEGMTDNSGKVMVDAKQMDGYQLFLQSVGLNPAQVSEQYAKKRAIENAKQFDKGHHDRLLNRFARADTNEARQQISVEIAEFNKHNPEAVITRSAMLQAIRARAEGGERMQKFGSNLRGREVLYKNRADFAEDFNDEE